MHQPRTRPGRAPLVLAVCVALAAAALAGCGSDSSSSASSDRPEDVKVPISEVREKLPRIVEDGNEAKAAAARGAWDKAAGDYEDLHETWEEVEGTVKDADADLYEQIETAQGLIHDGAEAKNAQRVATGADDQAASVQKFLDAHAS